MPALILCLAALLASDYGGQQPPPFGGQQPPPPVLRWEWNCTAWAVVYEWADGTRTSWTGATDDAGLVDMLDALADPFAASSITECYTACHELCNEGMPPGSPNAVCSATWIGATQTCQCICRNLDGDCPRTPPLPDMPPATNAEWSQYDHELWTLELAWTKRHTGR